MNRLDIRTLARDYLNEATADLWTEATLNRLINEEIRSLPRKDIYLEEIHTVSTGVDQFDYTLPTGTVKVEKVEKNVGTSSKPDWQEWTGWDNYAGALYLRSRPTTAWTMRIHIKKKFTELSDDTTATDIPDEKVEVLVWGTVVRAYKALMGYFVDAKNWDSVAKPDGIGMSQVQNWLIQAKAEYRELVNLYKTSPRPRDINLTG